MVRIFLKHGPHFFKHGPHFFKQEVRIFLKHKIRILVLAHYRKGSQMTQFLVLEINIFMFVYLKDQIKRVEL